MQELHLPWQELSVILPLIGALAVGLLRDRDAMYRLTVAVCGVTLVFAIGEWIDFARLNTFEAHDHWDVLNGLFRQDVFVIDELNAPLLPMAALLYLATVLSTARTKISRFSFASTLVSEALILATLSSRQPLMITVRGEEVAGMESTIGRTARRAAEPVAHSSDRQLETVCVSSFSVCSDQRLGPVDAGRPEQP